ncbi:hypothetical protein [Synechococcus sp. RSCCF101]|uniref:hypothetical protein n=1 Tax=Synechococcus sp. RSCCF101 TaxID=2511069 RepID=UPI001CDA3908|nr:hypothetical protein [Synechococcus sp. RSCCF101]
MFGANSGGICATSPDCWRLLILEARPLVKRYVWKRAVTLIYVAVDDATHQAYVEVEADAQKPTVIGFLP